MADQNDYKTASRKWVANGFAASSHTHVKSELSAEVQASLEKADTAFEKAEEAEAVGAEIKKTRDSYRDKFDLSIYDIGTVRVVRDGTFPIEASGSRFDFFGLEVRGSHTNNFTVTIIDRERGDVYDLCEVTAYGAVVLTGHGAAATCADGTPFSDLEGTVIVDITAAPSANDSIAKKSDVPVVVDPSASATTGQAADAKAVGKALANKASISDIAAATKFTPVYGWTLGNHSDECLFRNISATYNDVKKGWDTSEEISTDGGETWATMTVGAEDNPDPDGTATRVDCVSASFIRTVIGYRLGTSATAPILVPVTEKTGEETGAKTYELPEPIKTALFAEAAFKQAVADKVREMYDNAEEVRYPCYENAEITAY